MPTDVKAFYHDVQYLGDSVYTGVTNDTGQLVIFLYNGDQPKNVIYLDDEVIKNFIAIIKKYKI